MDTPAPTPDAILAAAERLVIREGIVGLTIESVAREAGLSKGGVLYHYPSKERLISAMIGRFAAHFERDLARHHAEQPAAPGNWTRAFLQATLQPACASCRDGAHGIELFAALTAALANNPELLEPLRERYRAWQQRLEEDDLDPARATVVRLAADGLWFAELFGFGPPRDGLRRRVIEEMERLTRPEAK